MRMHPSVPGLSSLGLTAVTAALAVLGAPELLWVVTLVLGVALLVLALLLQFQNTPWIAAAFRWLGFNQGERRTAGVSSVPASADEQTRGPRMAEKDQQGNVYNIGNVTSHGEGSVAAGVINISAPQRSSVKVAREAEFEPTDQGYMTRIRVDLEAPYAARNLVIFVQGTGIKATGVNRVDPSASLSTGAITYRGKPGTMVGAPLTNAYRVFIVTERPDAQINVEALLDIDP